MPNDREKQESSVRITRTELVWPGKYAGDGTLKEAPRVRLPFQIIESINESRETRRRKRAPEQTTLFDAYEATEGDSFEQGWRNKLIWGDNFPVLCSLVAKFAGKVDLIYIDPPFATGADFRFEAEIGDGSSKIAKEQSIIEEKAYRDTWGQGLDSYLAMMRDRLVLMRDILAPTGTIFVHTDWTAGHYLKLLLDEIFGSVNFRNEIVWYYTNKLGTGGNTFDKHHDVLLVYVKSDSWVHNPIMRGVKKQKMQPVTKKVEGERIWLRDEKGKRVYALGKAETKVGDVWEVPYINPVASERLGFPTQKPIALLDWVIKASTKENDLVADFFVGSGTTLAAAEQLGRRWIGCDMSRWAIHISKKRLLELPKCQPFEVLNLGKYERQYWQVSTFAGADSQEKLLFEYLAFILKLYNAQPIAGFSHIHGKKGAAMVHVGAVDAPVTIDDISTAMEECLKLKRTELHILGWEWEMGLYDLMTKEASKRGIKLLLLQIPREVMERQAVEQQDIRFFELAYLEIAIGKPKKLTVTAALKDFVIPNTELIPEEVRAKVKKWSDYIDYWAVDWDFQNDTFVQGFVAYRTREDRTLALAADPHTYPKPGKYRIVVKVVDIFGNDTSQVYDAEVK